MEGGLREAAGLWSAQDPWRCCRGAGLPGSCYVHLCAKVEGLVALNPSHMGANVCFCRWQPGTGDRLGTMGTSRVLGPDAGRRTTLTGSPSPHAFVTGVFGSALEEGCLPLGL